MIPAPRLFVALALVTLLLLAAPALPALVAVVLVLDALLLAAAVIDARRAAATVLEASREWPPLLTIGTLAEVTVRLVSRADQAVTLRCRDGLHPAIATAPAYLSLDLLPHGNVSWRLALAPRLRGEHAVLPLTIRVLGPMGLAWAQREELGHERCRVYPRVHWEGSVGHLLELAHRRELGRVDVAWRGDGTEPYALRDYLPGDPPRVIHWKATARHGHPVTRERTAERGARIVVLLDCARAMTSTDSGASKLDHALAAALALTRVASSRGDRVTVVAFADRIRRVVRVKPGSRGIAAAYRALYDLEASGVEPAYDLAAEHVGVVESRRALIVLLTSVVDLAAAELLREALLRLSRRHRPLLVNLEDPELLSLAASAPDAAPAAFAKTSALRILAENRFLSRRLRRAGIRVVNVGADRLALATVDGYLAMLQPHGRPAAKGTV
jgi:uncharacterized protein (DUF58 family)